MLELFNYHFIVLCALDVHFIISKLHDEVNYGPSAIRVMAVLY